MPLVKLERSPARLTPTTEPHASAVTNTQNTFQSNTTIKNPYSTPRPPGNPSRSKILAPKLYFLRPSSDPPFLGCTQSPRATTTFGIPIPLLLRMYRDSHYQSIHMLRAHHALYLDWNHDVFVAPDQPVSNAPRPDPSSLPINPFWDYFHDDDDWDRFHPLQVCLLYTSRCV